MVKEKQTRTYDQDGFRKRAACLCVRDPQESEILLVTSSRATDHWIVPGGGVEPNENPSAAAIRETEEEAGVKGVIKRCLGDFEVRGENMERKHRTSVFVLEVHEELDEWEDSKSRKRRWFPVEEALKLLAIYKPVQCTYLNYLIQTSPTLCRLAPQLVPSENSCLSPSIPILSGMDSPSNNSSSLKITSFDPSSTSHYLKVSHYPSITNNSNNNNNNNGQNSSNNISSANFHTFICTRNVYSTDSETTEDGTNQPDPSNQFNSDVNRKDATMMTTTPNTTTSNIQSACVKSSDQSISLNADCNNATSSELILPNSSVNS